MLRQEQSNSIEKQQNQALKNIYGLGVSGAVMRSRAKIETLSHRRRKALEKFTRKNLNSPRFQNWFQERRHTGRERSTTRKYEEPITRTERYWNSPLNAMRRILNCH